MPVMTTEPKPKMKRITVEVTEDFHAAAKAEAARRKKTLKQWVPELIARELPSEEKKPDA